MQGPESLRGRICHHLDIHCNLVRGPSTERIRSSVFGLHGSRPCRFDTLEGEHVPSTEAPCSPTLLLEALPLASSRCRYGLNVAFNLQNKVIFNYFPYPWFVSSVHVVVGTIYCAVFYLIGLKKASFERVRGRGVLGGEEGGPTARWRWCLPGLAGL